MKKTLLVLLLAVLLLLTACASGRQAEAPAAAPEFSAYEKDYALLWQELENSYPYLSWLEARGVDVCGIRERYAEELSALSDEAAFAGMLQRMFRELGNFAHLNLITPEAYQMYYYVYLLDEEVSTLPSSAPFQELLQAPRLADLYQPPANAEVYQQTGPYSYPEVSVLYYPDCKALHLKFSSFAQELVERDRDVVAAALDKYPEAEHIIFDITGNTGGSDWYWMQNLVAPFGGSYSFAFRNYLKNSSTVERYLDGLETLPVSELTDAPAWVEELGLTRYFESHMTLPEDSGGSGAPVESQAKRWLLVDGAVYSASEKLACFCKAGGWATVVGTRTAGDGLGATPALILLPESGLLVRFSTEAGENPDGTLNAAQGTAPDYLCLRGQLPLSRCLELIRGEGEKK